MEIELRALPFDVSANSNGDKLIVSGIVNRLGSISEILTNQKTGRKFRETIEPGVFDRALGNASRVDFLSMHDKNQVLSTTDNGSLELRETPQGLQMDANISTTSWGKDTYQLISDGIIKGMSFGMQVLKQSWSMGDDNIPLRTIKDINLFEVSAVRSPAYKSSAIEARDTDNIIDVDIPSDIEEREIMEAKDKKQTDSTEEEKKNTSTKEQSTDKKDEASNDKSKTDDKEDTSKETSKETSKDTSDNNDDKKDEKPTSKKKEARDDVTDDETRSIVESLRNQVEALSTEIKEFRSFKKSIEEEKRSKEQAEIKDEEKRDLQTKEFEAYFKNRVI